MKRPLLSIFVVGLVLLAGCTGLGGQGDQSTTDATTEATEATTTAAQTTTANATTAAQTTTQQTTEATTQEPTETSAPREAWTRPQPPNTPLQNNMGEENGSRIFSVEVVDGNGSSSEGYSSVELEVTANTSMQRVDPAEHGTVDGEPYFLVYVNGYLEKDGDHTRAKGTLVDRQNVTFKERGTYSLSIPAEAFEESNAEEGEVEIMVLLLDADKTWDDIYGAKNVTVNYKPKE
ncbi:MULTISPECIES: hypothetical protein [unclassified Haladaptatus]|uniref:hypothetical protein n=1 Tax=unclassified Haladaptatus TaxID=2622732 RepID=UPI0023E886A2|nr:MULTISPECIES: hypothetical protein [unclassified Haladaptatus]